VDVHKSTLNATDMPNSPSPLVAERFHSCHLAYQRAHVLRFTIADAKRVITNLTYYLDNRTDYSTQSVYRPSL